MGKAAVECGGNNHTNPPIDQAANVRSVAIISERQIIPDGISKIKNLVWSFKLEKYKNTIKSQIVKKVNSPVKYFSKRDSDSLL
jgi:hypothetical protein